MVFEYKIIQKKDLKPSVWNGGETFEYFIYPKYSLYTERNFSFRISSASIHKIPSRFTQFNHYKRYLVMLNSSLKINRNGKEENYTEEDIFEFPSADEITSFSLGNDFNLMVAENVKHSSVEITRSFSDSKADFLALFAKEETQLKVNDKEFILNPNDLLIIENTNKENLELESNNELILSTIEL